MGLAQPLLEGWQSHSGDLETLRSWLEKAVQKIIMPCVRISKSDNGLLLHIDISDETLREGTCALIDEILTEKERVESLLKSYGGILSLFLPGMPESYDELLRVWESARNGFYFNRTDFRITADLTVSDDMRGGREVTCAGDINIMNAENARFGFEWASSGPDSDLTASLEYTDYRSYQSLSYELELHTSENGLRGSLAAPDGITYLLDATREVQDGILICRACLSGVSEGRALGQYDLEVRYDTVSSSLNAALTQSEPSGETAELASLQVTKRIKGWDAVLTAEGETVATGSLSIGDQYARIRLDIPSGRRYANPAIDLWYYHPAPDEYRIRLDTNIFTGGFRREIYSLGVTKNEAELDVTSGSMKLVHAGLAYTPSDNGFDVNAEFMDYYLLGSQPSTFHLKKDGRVYTAELAWDYMYRMAGTADAKLVLGQDGDFRSLDMNAVTEDRMNRSAKQSYSISCTPGVLLFRDGNNLYELSVVEDTAEKLALRLTMDDRTELADLVLTLDGQGSLNGVLTSMDREIGRLVIEPVEKQAPDVMDRSGALVIDQAFLEQLVSSMAR